METNVLHEAFKLASETGNLLPWLLIYLVYAQNQMKKELEIWRGDVEKRLTILETVQLHSIGSGSSASSDSD